MWRSNAQKMTSVASENSGRRKKNEMIKIQMSFSLLWGVVARFTQCTAAELLDTYRKVVNRTAIDPPKSAKEQNKQEVKTAEATPTKATSGKADKRLPAPTSVPMSVAVNDSGSAVKKATDDRSGDRYSFALPSFTSPALSSGHVLPLRNCARRSDTMVQLVERSIDTQRPTLYHALASTHPQDVPTSDRHIGSLVLITLTMS